MPVRDTTTSLKNSPPSIRELLFGLWHHISRLRRIQLGLLLVVMLASAGAELLSLGLVLPFLAVLSNPERLWQQPLVQDIAVTIGITKSGQLLLPITVAFGTASLFLSWIRIANLWLNLRLAAEVGSDLSYKAYKLTLYQPYGVHLQRDSATVIAVLTKSTAKTVLALKSLLQLLTAVVVTTALLVGLLLIDWQIALGAIILIGGVYGILLVASRRELLRNGVRIEKTGRQQIKAVQEGLGAIRDVLLDNNQSTYLKIYKSADRPQRILVAKNQFIASFPRYAIEGLAMVSVSLIAGIALLQKGSVEAIIPLMGGLALGAQRMLPALHQIYSGWAGLRGQKAHIERLFSMLDQPQPPKLDVAVKPLELGEGIRFVNISFSYGSEQTKVLNGLDLEISRGERIGLIGSTGSGKSTFIDLLLGLQKPTGGSVLLDNLDLHDSTHPERLAAWQASISHVPQNIFLSDSSIAENIAFGVPRRLIDLDRVKHSAEQAQIASFIETSPQGYDSFVGERGVRLSGGQRQRIGIARALYKQAQVLIFDEATSALDTVTEEALMQSINLFSKNLTVVMIAHRLSTLQLCHRIIRLKNGRVVEEGVPHKMLFGEWNS